MLEFAVEGLSLALISFSLDGLAWRVRMDRAALWQRRCFVNVAMVSRRSSVCKHYILGGSVHKLF